MVFPFLWTSSNNFIISVPVFWSSEPVGSSARSKLNTIKNKIEISERTKEKYTNQDIVKDIQEVFDELEPIQHKYDYSKLPKKP